MEGGGFSVILKAPILRIPKIGCINMHSSLLPRHRGANPFCGAILAGDEETGITFHVIDEGIDTGPIVHQVAFNLGPRDTAYEVYLRACGLAQDHVAAALDFVANYGLEGLPQASAPADGLPRGPFPTIAALCAAWNAAVDPRVASAFARGEIRSRPEAPHCGPADVTVGAPASIAAQGPFEEAAWLTLTEPYTSSTRLALRTAQGWSVTEIALDERGHDDPGCAHVGLDLLEDVKLVRTEAGRDVVLLRTLEADAYWARSPDEIDPSGIVEYAHACEVDGEGRAICQGPVEVGRVGGWPSGWVPFEGRVFAPDPERVKWTKRRTATLGPAGDLRGIDP